MKRNKKLEKIANDSLRQYENDDIKQSIFADSQKIADERKRERREENKQALRSKPLALVMSTVACLMIIVVSLVCILIPDRASDKKADYDYAKDFSDPHEEDIDTINAFLNGCTVNAEVVVNAYGVKACGSTTYDYYLINVESSDDTVQEGYLFAGDIKISVSSYLSYLKTERTKTADLSMGTIRYDDECTFEDDVYSYEFTGWMEIDGRLFVFTMETLTYYEEYCTPQFYVEKLIFEKSIGTTRIGRSAF